MKQIKKNINSATHHGTFVYKKYILAFTIIKMDAVTSRGLFLNVFIKDSQRFLIRCYVNIKSVNPGGKLCESWGKKYL